MLSRENSDLLIAVRGGTPCGDWLRSFWFPIAISDRWTGLGAQLRLAEPMTYCNRVGTPTSFGQEQMNFTGKPLRVQILARNWCFIAT